jgi:hypothetical protein
MDPQCSCGSRVAPAWHWGEQRPELTARLRRRPRQEGGLRGPAKSSCKHTHRKSRARAMSPVPARGTAGRARAWCLTSQNTPSSGPAARAVLILCSYSGCKLARAARLAMVFTAAPTADAPAVGGLHFVEHRILQALTTKLCIEFSHQGFCAAIRLSMAFSDAGSAFPASSRQRPPAVFRSGARQWVGYNCVFGRLQTIKQV